MVCRHLLPLALEIPRAQTLLGHRSLVEVETPFANIQLIFLDGGVLHTKLKSFGFLLRPGEPRIWNNCGQRYILISICLS